MQIKFEKEILIRASVMWLRKCHSVPKWMFIFHCVQLCNKNNCWIRLHTQSYSLTCSKIEFLRVLFLRYSRCSMHWANTNVRQLVWRLQVRGRVYDVRLCVTGGDLRGKHEGNDILTLPNQVLMPIFLNEGWILQFLNDLSFPILDSALSARPSVHFRSFARNVVCFPRARARC